MSGLERIAVIVQARVSSTRRPGKVLHRVAGRPLLGFLLERLAHSASHLPIIVATSTDPSDDPLVEYCRGEGVETFRGSLIDVASRFADVAQSCRLDGFVRLNGDSPLLDPALVTRALALFRTQPADLVTNVHPRTFPRGESVEMIKASAFLAAFHRMREPADREHVTRWFYRHPDAFTIRNFAADSPHPDLQLAVDTPDDLARFEAIVTLMERPQWTYGLDEVIALSQAVSSRRVPA
ncbi:MAG TPA: NTP transferase domain-containing protein [Gemmatimonadales bacterium]|nr:NTP transferase domain-containing protein [Gemmatimonadales bacterium]